MIAAAWARVPNEWRIDGILVLLAVVAFVAGGAASLLMRAPTITRTHTIRLTPAQAVSTMSARAIVAALGKPDQSQKVSGGVCDVWQARALEICYRP